MPEHYFCDKCRKIREASIVNNPAMGHSHRWEPINNLQVKCGQRSENGELKEGGAGCGEPATERLVSIGGNPIIYLS
jgi:hypothetical protein